MSFPTSRRSRHSNIISSSSNPSTFPTIHTPPTSVVHLRFGLFPLLWLVVRRRIRVLIKFSVRVFLAMSSDFTFGDNLDWLFNFFTNLDDRDCTGYQITQTPTLSRLHAQLEQTKRIGLFTHTQRVDLDQTRGIRLFNHLSQQTRKPLFQRSENPWLWRTCVHNSQVQ